VVDVQVRRTDVPSQPWDEAAEGRRGRPDKHTTTGTDDLLDQSMSTVEYEYSRV
jgi:hypothetical protein